MGLVCPVMKYGLFYTTLDEIFNEKREFIQNQKSETVFKPIYFGHEKVILET